MSRAGDSCQNTWSLARGCLEAPQPHMASAGTRVHMGSCAFLAVGPPPRWALQIDEGRAGDSREKQAWGFSQILLQGPDSLEGIWAHAPYLM